MVTEFNKVFLDTAPIIYFLDDDINHSKKWNRFLKNLSVQKQS